VPQAGNREGCASTGERVGGRGTTSWTGSFCIVAVGDKLTIGFVGNARRASRLKRSLGASPDDDAERIASGPDGLSGHVSREGRKVARLLGGPATRRLQGSRPDRQSSAMPMQPLRRRGGRGRGPGLGRIRSSAARSPKPSRAIQMSPLRSYLRRRADGESTRRRHARFPRKGGEMSVTARCSLCRLAAKLAAAAMTLRRIESRCYASAGRGCRWRSEGGACELPVRRRECCYSRQVVAPQGRRNTATLHAYEPRVSSYTVRSNPRAIVLPSTEPTSVQSVRSYRQRARCAPVGVQSRDCLYRSATIAVMARRGATGQLQAPTTLDQRRASRNAPIRHSWLLRATMA